jgi:hypothetical protein
VIARNVLSSLAGRVSHGKKEENQYIPQIR